MQYFDMQLYLFPEGSERPWSRTAATLAWGDVSSFINYQVRVITCVRAHVPKWEEELNPVTGRSLIIIMLCAVFSRSRPFLVSLAGKLASLVFMLTTRVKCLESSKRYHKHDLFTLRWRGGRGSERRDWPSPLIVANGSFKL